MRILFATLLTLSILTTSTHAEESARSPRESIQHLIHLVNSGDVRKAMEFMLPQSELEAFRKEIERQGGWPAFSKMFNERKKNRLLETLEAIKNAKPHYFVQDDEKLVFLTLAHPIRSTVGVLLVLDGTHYRMGNQSSVNRSQAKSLVTAGHIPKEVIEREHAPSKKDDTSGVGKLCEELVEAVRNDDIVAYAHCWLPQSAIDQYLNSPPPGFPPMPPKDKLDEIRPKMKQYFLKRNQVVANSFHALRKQLKKLNPDVSKIRLASVKPQFEIQDGINTVTMCNLVIQVDEKQTLEFVIDDAFQVYGRWYFTDKPMGSFPNRRDVVEKKD